MTTPDEQMIYAAVVQRRASMDNLLWQAPVLSLTAQAFLFSIALTPNNGVAARIIASVLAVLVAILSVTLMTRHRQLEFIDSEWLKRFESRFGEELQVHGDVWARRIKPLSGGDAWLWKFVLHTRGYVTWVIGLYAFGAAAVVVVGLSIFLPGSL